MNNASFIKFSNVSFRYGDELVLKDVNLSFLKGGFYILLGPNGGGKSTLLKLLLGVYQASKGKVTIEGKPPKEALDKVGYVPQNLAFDPQFPITVYQFVRMGALSEVKWHGKYAKSVNKRVNDLLQLFDLTPLKDRLFSSLSGGQRQRVAIARSLIKDPEILLLDEPTTGLDQSAITMIESLIKKLKGKRTILMVTHTLTSIINEANKCILLNQSVEEVPKEKVCCHHALGVYHNHLEAE